MRSTLLGMVTDWATAYDWLLPAVITAETFFSFTNQSAWIRARSASPPVSHRYRVNCLPLTPRPLTCSSASSAALNACSSDSSTGAPASVPEWMGNRPPRGMSPASARPLTCPQPVGSGRHTPCVQTLSAPHSALVSHSSSPPPLAKPPPLAHP